jgi:hypothetical protein
LTKFIRILCIDSQTKRRPEDESKNLASSRGVLALGLPSSARPFDEANLFEIASAYEASTKHRRPPKAFGPIKGEP